ncbi:MAG TPA: histidine kinase, partial [Burkholderiaceae bacterium]
MTGVRGSAFQTRWSEPRSSVSRAAWAYRPMVLLFGLLGLLIVLGVVRALADAPTIDAGWHTDDQDRVTLMASAEPALQAHAGQVLTSIVGVEANAAAGSSAGSATPGVPVGTDSIALRRSPRWVLDDRDRARQRAAQMRLQVALAAPVVRFVFADGSEVELRPKPRALLSLPAGLWLLCGASLMLYLTSLRVVLNRANLRNLLYGLMAWCQAGNLLLIGIEMSVEFGPRGPLARWGLLLHVAFDLVTASAMVTAAALHPARLPGARWISLAAWSASGLLIALLATGALHNVWWWTQGLVLAMGVLIVGLFSWSYRIESHPLAIVLRQLGLITAATWALMTLALAGSDGLRSVPHYIGDTVAVIWYTYLASVLLLVPFLARARNLMREFALLAAVSTIAISLYLLFVAVFGLGQLPALTLALFVSLGVYSVVRQWILSQLFGSSVMTTERVFEQLYRIAREVESRPERAPALMSQLLRE